MRILAPVFAFVGSGCLLVLELVAARLVAPDLGVSLYTWTSVIGVVLAGVTLGNFLGGRLADRRPDTSALALVYLAAAAATLVVLGVLRVVHSIELPVSAPALLQVLWVTALLFLLPATLLAMPTPLLTRLLLTAVEEGGRVVGRIQAAAALGSIVGTFLTGFFLISEFGTRHIVAGIAVILLLLCVLSRPRWLRRPKGISSAAGIVVVVALAATAVGAGWAAGSPCLRESDYYCIALEPGPSVPAGERALVLDGLVHATVDLAHPGTLTYPYEMQYASVLKAAFRPQSRVDAFFLGGGGYVFPRWLEAHYGGESTVAEIDPQVTQVAERYLELRPSRRLRLLTGDARRVLGRLPRSERFAAVIGDAFNGMEVPWQLTTWQFDALVAAHLRPHGIFLLNVIDGVHDAFLRSELRTLRRVFPYVAVATGGTWPPGRPRVSFVLVAAKTRPRVRLPVVGAAALDRFVANGHSVLLSDDHAPVEQLLAPVSAQLMRSQIETGG